MGAGKSTIGKALSHNLNLPFVDIDHLVVDKAGAPIPWIFDVEGEDGFRRREKNALLEAIEGEVSIIATGGGIISVEENRRLLRKLTGVVYLNTSVEQQFQRTSKDKNRPLLQTENPMQTLADLMEVREPFYKDVAAFEVSTDANRPKIVVEQIASYWKSL
jgi:shikimate kinase